MVESAHLADRAGRSEMRIELRTEAWGAVSIRAVVRDNHLGAAIAVQGREAQSILISELPRLEQSLAARDVRLEHLEVLPGPMGSGTGEAGRNPENAGYRQHAPAAKQDHFVMQPDSDRAEIHRAHGESIGGTRLSIRV